MFNDQNKAYPSGVMFHTGPKSFARAIMVNEFDAKSWKIIPFSQDVNGFLESNTTTCLMLDNEVIREGSNYNDFYGFLTSPSEEIFDKSPKYPLVRVATTTINLNYFVENKEGRLGRDQEHSYLPRDWCEVSSNSIENIERWYMASLEERYADNTTLVEPKWVSDENIVGKVEFNSNMTKDEIFQTLDSLLIELRQRFPQCNWEFISKEINAHWRKQEIGLKERTSSL